MIEPMWLKAISCSATSVVLHRRYTIQPLTEFV